MQGLGWFLLIYDRLRPREVARYVVALDGPVGRDEWPWRRWRRPVVDAVVLREDVRLVVDLAAATEVEAIDAGAEVRAISLRAGEREHAHARFATPA